MVPLIFPFLPEHTRGPEDVHDAEQGGQPDGDRPVRQVVQLRGVVPIEGKRKPLHIAGHAPTCQWGGGGKASDSENRQGGVSVLQCYVITFLAEEHKDRRAYFIESIAKN